MKILNTYDDQLVDEYNRLFPYKVNNYEFIRYF